MELNLNLKEKILNFLPNRKCKCCSKKINKLTQNNFCSYYCFIDFNSGMLDFFYLFLILFFSIVLLGNLTLLKIFTFLLIVMSLQLIFIFLIDTTYTI